ncbi:MAG TPA: ATP-grasp fold amidoligase family protein [Defluviitoga tunisiensis]|nr:ATP-grasp fold amidoligase family protein [Defluviitoga tunisiensis]
MKKKLKHYYYNSKIGYYLLDIPYKLWNYYRVIRYKKLSDEEFIKMKYKKLLDRDLDLKNPKLFTEKIQWLKLNDRKDIYTKCADKYLVRNYIKEKIGEKYLIPLVFVTEDYKDINEDNLPDYPVIVKTTHDSGGNFIIQYKKNFDFKRLQRVLACKLKNNYYYLNREWEYKNIKPSIIVEKLLKDDSGNMGSVHLIV